MKETNLDLEPHRVNEFSLGRSESTVIIVVIIMGYILLRTVT